MWKLMISDSFHFNKATPQSIFYIVYFNFYFNFITRISDSGYAYALTILTLFMLFFFMISPVKLAKGLYLCPLTEAERKNYLKMVCAFRFVVFELFIGILLFVFRYYYAVEAIKLLLTFLCFSGVLLTSLFLGGFYNPSTVRQQYYIANRLPVPKELKVSKEKYKTPSVGNYMLIIVLILCAIGMLFTFQDHSFDFRWLFYYIPAIIVSGTCLLIYFMKYFDIFITINANHEVYSYTRRKKAGVFHAD